VDQALSFSVLMAFVSPFVGDKTMLIGHKKGTRNRGWKLVAASSFPGPLLGSWISQRRGPGAEIAKVWFSLSFVVFQSFVIAPRN